MQENFRQDCLKIYDKNKKDHGNWLHSKRKVYKKALLDSLAMAKDSKQFWKINIG